MADFNQPQNSSSANGVLDALKNQIISVAKFFVGTSDSNVPDGFHRYDDTSKKFQRKNGASWTDLNFHAAIDAAIAAVAASAVVPPGTILDFAGSAAPTGYLFCQGQAISRATYSTLFTAIGTTFGVGDGSTTFNLPDTQERFKLGRKTSGSYQTLGQTGGALDHTHSIAAHQHTIPTHTHTMGNHTHSVGAHTHTIPAHSHSVPGHYHDANLGGADIQITSSGSHQHYVPSVQNGAVASVARTRTPEGDGGSNQTTHIATVADSTSNHTHPHSSIIGRVGYVTGGISGDGAMSTATDGSSTSSSSGGGTTGNPSSNTTDASGILTSNTGEGAQTSGTNNPKYIIFNCIIKT